MSYRTDDDRPKLKAKRFNTFETISAVNREPHKICSTINEPLAKKTSKRPCEEENIYTGKKFCRSFPTPQLTNKNLANNRLESLRKTLRNDLIQKNAAEKKNCGFQEISSKVSTNSCQKNKPQISQITLQKNSSTLTESSSESMNQPLHSKNFAGSETDGLKVSRSDAYLEYKEPQSSPAQLYRNSHTANHTSHMKIYHETDKLPKLSTEYTTKNLANQRLSRMETVTNSPLISNTLQNSDVRKFNCDRVTGTPPNPSLTNRISGLKRSIDATSAIDADCYPFKMSPQNFAHNSPLLRGTASNDSSNIDKNSGDSNISSPESSSKPALKSSNRIMRIKRYMETINNGSQSPLDSTNSKTHMQGIVKEEKSNSGTDCFKKPTDEFRRIKLNQNIQGDDMAREEKISHFDNYIKKSNYKNGASITKPKSDFIPPTPVSSRMKMIRMSPSGSQETSDSHPTGGQPSIQKPIFHPDTASNFDNHRGKWERTRAWVWNHQNINGTPATVVSSEIVSEPMSEKQVRLDDIEEMEWTNAEPDGEEMTEPQKRVAINNVDKEEPLERVEPNNEDKEDPKNSERLSEPSKELCIVVDTNVFISGLSKVKDIMNLKITESIVPIIYVPWMVITELDFMKHSCSDDKLQQKVNNAIKFINTALENKHPRFIGQTIHDMETQKTIGISPDDKIMSCCLQASQKYETVILLSNDLNLRNKAMINDISASSANEIAMRILSKSRRTVKSQKAMTKMASLCSAVICECAEQAFGDVWAKMEALSGAPWPLKECLRRFRKFWPTVFRERVMKQFTMAVEQLSNFLHRKIHFVDDSEDYIKFMQLCINLCIFMKDIDACRGSVENTLRDITKL